MSLRIPRCMLPILTGLALVTGILMLLGTDAQASDRVAPVLIDKSPAANVYTAAVNASVGATYDQDMDPATVNFQTFAVHGMQTGWFTETLTVTGGTILLTPTMPFHPGELVQVSATTATLSLGAEAPAAPTVWQFWATATGGTARFLASAQPFASHDNRGLAMGDLDGDGDVDAYVGDFEGPDQVYLNDGSGVFVETMKSQGTAGTIGVVLGDLDGDGDLDVFEAKGLGMANHIWWNDGAANFTDSGQSLGSSHSFYPALGDVDGDGDLDIFVPNGEQQMGGAGEPNKVYLNDGSGVFSDSGQSLGLMKSMAAVLGDLDGDGDLDAFVANGGFFAEANEVWFNDGSGSFTNSGQALGNDESIQAVLGDLDGDGDLDAVVTNANVPAGGEADEVWLNDGSGIFTLAKLLGTEPSIGAALGDLDDDGDLDILVCQQYHGAVWLNDGTAVFSQSGRLLNLCAFPALVDLDGDGDLDAFLANTTEAPYPNEVWFNGPVQELYLPLLARE